MGTMMGANTQISRSVAATQSKSIMPTTTLFQSNVGCIGTPLTEMAVMSVVYFVLAVAIEVTYPCFV